MIQTETFRALRPTWSGERQPLPLVTPETVNAHEEIMEHPLFHTMASAIVVFNAALCFHRQGLKTSQGNNCQEAHLDSAMQLYYMVRNLVAGSSDCGAFQATCVALSMAATNNLIQIHRSLGQGEEANQREEEAWILLTREDILRFEVDLSISQCLELNLATRTAASA